MEGSSLLASVSRAGPRMAQRPGGAGTDGYSGESAPPPLTGSAARLELSRRLEIACLRAVAGAE